MVDGSKTPELIPSDVAFRLILYSLRVPSSPTQADLSKQKSRFRRINLTPQDEETVIALLAEFEKEHSSFRTLSSNLASPSAQIEAARKRDGIVTRYQTLMMSQLSPGGRDKFMAYVLSERRKMYSPAQ